MEPSDSAFQTFPPLSSWSSTVAEDVPPEQSHLDNPPLPALDNFSDSMSESVLDSDWSPSADEMPDTPRQHIQGRKYRSRYDDFTTIDWIHDFSLDRRRALRFERTVSRLPSYVTPGSILYGICPVLLSREDVIQRIRWIYTWLRSGWQASQGWLLVTIMGIVIGVVAAWMEVVTGWLSDVKIGYCHLVRTTSNGDPMSTGWYLNRKFCCWETQLDSCPYWHTWTPFDFFNFFVYAGFGLVMAIASFILVQTFGPYAASSGLPEVRTILGGFVIHQFLGVRTGAIKVVSLVLSSASGLSLGMEAPMVHISCCIGNILPRFFRKFHRNEARKREVLSAAAAAGIAVSFGAPLAGVLFSLEEASTYFPQKTLWKSFFCSIVAAAMLQLMNPFRTGKLVLFQTTYDRNWHAWEVVCFAMLGALGGLYGTLFIRWNQRIASFRRYHPFWNGSSAKWADWFVWAPPLWAAAKDLWNRRRYGLQPLEDDAPLPSSVSEAEDIATPTAKERHFSSASNRRWWNPSKTTIYRCFQELVIVSLLTSAMSYGNPFMQQDMTLVLAGLLKECRNDAIIIGRQNPNIPSKLPKSLISFMPSANPNVTYISDEQDVFHKNSSGEIIHRRDILFGLAANDTGEPTDDGPVQEDDDFFRLCYNSSDAAYTFGRLMTLLLVTIAARFMLTVVTFGLRVPGGVYMPSMVIGACVGRFFGMTVRSLVEWLQGTSTFDFLYGGSDLSAKTIIITPGTYALIGAASFLGGVTKFTVTIVIMMFEITGGAALTFIVPLMIAVMTAKFVGDALDKDKLGSITDMFISFHGYPLLDLKREWDFFRLRPAEQANGETSAIAALNDNMVCETIIAAEVMAPANRLVVLPAFQEIHTNQHSLEVHVTPCPHSVESISQLLRQSSYQGYPVVQTRENMLLVGYVSRVDMLWALDRARRFNSIAETAPCYLYSQHYPFHLAGHRSPASVNVLIDVPPSSSPGGSHPPTKRSPHPTTYLEASPHDLANYGEDGQLRNFINFSPWIDRTPITITTQNSMDLTLEMFKKLGKRERWVCDTVDDTIGLRYVLVTKEFSPEMVPPPSGQTTPSGSLAGLITKKDVLRYIENMKDEDDTDTRQVRPLREQILASLPRRSSSRNRRPASSSRLGHRGSFQSLVSSPLAGGGNSSGNIAGATVSTEPAAAAAAGDLEAFLQVSGTPHRFGSGGIDDNSSSHEN